MGPVVEADVVAQYDRIAGLPEYAAAELALGVAIARSGREREQAALGGPLLQLVQDPTTNDASTLRPIAEPALAAVLALMMQDLLTLAEFEHLYGAFASAIPLHSLS